MYGSSLPIGGQSNVYLANFMKRWTNPSLIGLMLAPIVPVTAQVGNYMVLDRANQRVVASTLRAPGTRPIQLSMAYSKDEYVCRPHAASIPLPRENVRTASQQYSLDLKQSAVGQVKDTVDIRREAEIAALARNVNNATTLSGSDLWSNPASNPIAQIESRKLMVKLSGRMATHLFLGPDVAAAARQNPSIIERFKYAQGGNITNEMLATAFGVANVVEAGAVQTDGLDQPSFMWAGLVILAYVQPVVSQMDISPMKTFVDVTEGVDGYEAIEFPDPYPDRKTDWVSGEMVYALKITGQDTIAVLKGVV